MKTKSLGQLEKEIRNLKREVLALEKLNKQLSIENRNMIRDWHINQETFKKQIRKLSDENRLLSAKNQLFESMKK